MNRRLVILAVTGAVVLAGCARMMAQNPPSEPMRASSGMAAPAQEALSQEAPRTEAPKAPAAKPSAPKPKPKAVPRASSPRR